VTLFLGDDDNPQGVENPGERHVVGLDLSLTATGIALPDGTSLTARPRDLAGVPRLLWIRRQVAKAVGLAPLRDGSLAPRATVVMIEGPAFMAKGSHQWALGGLAWSVYTDLHQAGVPYVEVIVQHIKTLATGRGNAPKVQMVTSARERLGYRGHDDNQADALWLRQMGLLTFGVEEVPLPATHLAKVPRYVGKVRAALAAGER
jgi:hypothetical protein